MRTIALALATAGLLVMANAAVADDCCAPANCGTPTCCGRCGCHGPLKKVCRVVCEMKEVKVTCWDVECDDFCVPLPGCGHGCCGQSCGEPGCCDSGCGCAKPVTPPKCGKVRCRKKLVKRVVTKKVPVYKCVVEYVCAGCCGESCGAHTEETAPIAAKAKAQPAPKAPLPKAPTP